MGRFTEVEGTTGIAGFSSMGDMEKTIRECDDTKFRARNGDTAYVRVKEDQEAGRRSVLLHAIHGLFPRARNDLSAAPAGVSEGVLLWDTVIHLVCVRSDWESAELIYKIS